MINLHTVQQKKNLPHTVTLLQCIMRREYIDCWTWFLKAPWGKSHKCCVESDNVNGESESFLNLDSNLCLYDFLYSFVN